MLHRDLVNDLTETRDYSKLGRHSGALQFTYVHLLGSTLYPSGQWQYLWWKLSKMTLKETCEPCAKRKVRCDRQEPCSNCKRRKKDRCTYPSVSPADRIRRLEALVRRLGGDPDDRASVNDQLRPEPALSTSTPTHSNAGLDNEQVVTPINIRSNDPVIMEEDGQPFYLESYVNVAGGRFDR